MVECSNGELELVCQPNGSVKVNCLVTMDMDLDFTAQHIDYRPILQVLWEGTKFFFCCAIKYFGAIFILFLFQLSYLVVLPAKK